MNQGKMSKPKYDIGERAINFAVRCAKLIGKLPRSIATIEYGKQLIRSSASVGANIEEADGTLTKRDFVNKMAISRREARESKYWLNLINKASLTDKQEMKNEMDSLLQEAHELMLILSSIVNKVRNMA
jgi:four helix bundle protein